MTTLVLGSTGLIGSAILRLSQQNSLGFEGINSSVVDLRNRSLVSRYFIEQKPKKVILAAARVGGIGANSKFPVEFLTDNILIQTNVLNAAFESGVEKVVFLGSSCIYPKLCPQPIKEDYLLTGPLEETNSAYAVAKISGVELIKSYRKQYKCSWISLMPTNLYGPNDNFDLETSHVVAALIHKFVKATDEGLEEVVLWGTGTSKREFMHVDDAARAIVLALDRYDSDSPLNIGVGQDIAIAELAEKVRNATGYRGKIIWDDSKPDGVPRKVLDVSRLKHLGFEPKVTLEEGLLSTVALFRANKGRMP